MKTGINLDETSRSVQALIVSLPLFQGVYPMTAKAAARLLVFQCVRDGGYTEQECPRGANFEEVKGILENLDYEVSMVRKGLLKKKQEKMSVKLRLSKSKMTEDDLYNEHSQLSNVEYLRPRSHPSDFEDDHVPHERAARALLVRLALKLGD